MASTSDIKNGMCINFNGQPFQVIEFLHVKPGKGAAFVRTKIKNLETGRVLDNTFPAGSKIETIDVETRQYQFLYNDGTDYHFMNTDNYEQLTSAKELINAPDFLVDGMMCLVLFHATENRAMAVELSYSKPEGYIRRTCSQRKHFYECYENRYGRRRHRYKFLFHQDRRRNRNQHCRRFL